MGDFVFSPPALVIGHAGSTDSMKASESFSPARIEKLMSTSPEMRAAFNGFRLVMPQIGDRIRSAPGSGLAVPHCSICLLDLFESAAHRCIVNAQMSRDLMKPVPMIVCLGYRSVSAFGKYPPSDGLTALNCPPDFV